MKKYINIYDICIVIVFILIAISLLIIFSSNSIENRKVLVFSNNELIDSIALYDDGIYEYNTEFGYNKIEIKDYKVSIIEADCPDQLCINQGYIDNSNELILCLPNRFIVEIENDTDDELDAVVN